MPYKFMNLIFLNHTRHIRHTSWWFMLTHFLLCFKPGSL